jgi:hypothetical protein
MLFFDSFALIEIIKGNENYRRYLEEIPITTKLNLMEVYYYLLREKDEQKAEFYYNFYLPSCVSVPEKVIKSAMKFKLKFKNKRLSYVDCIGYVFALELGLKFLTGDNEFKDFVNVEFIK